MLRANFLGQRRELPAMLPLMLLSLIDKVMLMFTFRDHELTAAPLMRMRGGYVLTSWNKGEPYLSGLVGIF